MDEHEHDFPAVVMEEPEFSALFLFWASLGVVSGQCLFLFGMSVLAWVS